MKTSSVSVVIPSYKGQALLAQHLPEVAKQLQSGDEIIVVDDASPEPDTTESWIQEQAKKYQKQGVSLRCLKHPKNLRFSAAVNTGVSAAQHALVWLLNNDVSPITENSVEKAHRLFANEATLFAVGCAEVQSLAPNAQRFGRGTGNFQRGLLTHWYDSEQNSTKTLWTAGGSMFVDRAKFLEIGGMDTLFYPAYEEDRDLSYRALKAGWSVRHAPEIVVHHQHATTNQTVFGNRGIQVASWKNQFLLVWKNISDPTFLLQHWLWLVYHLTISNLREKGAVGQGFFWALRLLPQVLKKRKQQAAHWQRTDRELLDQFGS